MDSVVIGTMKRPCVGSGFGLCAPDLGRDMDFEYDSEAERDTAYLEALVAFANMGIVLERR